MIVWEKGEVLRIREETEAVQRMVVRTEAGEEAFAVHYPLLLGRAEPGDGVWLNTTAVEMGLGTGGEHFVAGWISKRPQSFAPVGHIMKMRYTPWQIAVSTGEEEGNPHREAVADRDTLGGWPILLGELHSMLPIVAAVWRHQGLIHRKRPRVVYVMTDGGALPFALSQHGKHLQELGWLDATVTAGHAFGGEVEAVNLHSALLLARHALKGDLVFVSMGPGIVGTGTPFGFSGVEQGEAVNTVAALKGVPVFIPRIQGVDGRERHRGVSHHTLTNLERVALAPAEVPLPDPLEPELSLQVETIPRRHRTFSIAVTEVEAEVILRTYPFPLRSMGRGVSEDPLFFRTVCAGALHTWKRWTQIVEGRSSLSIHREYGHKP
ncbi:DUF3866 family protein [Desmospora profundinema]|uniref:DUF3866 family protein n=1 Tax=Desmospora profundinema TaxID=1571184 RepID=A0ABU1IJ59_9BACL|nr:DUF3866 family protein [Desmospora profundinema]MDR6224587.1 hypothetical protein [Desmospora profundinema]